MRTVLITPGILAAVTLVCAGGVHSAEEALDPGKVAESSLKRFGSLMDLARAPFEMMESDNPFFQKRDMYFFGRLDGEAVHFSGGLLANDGGLDVRRLRLGIVARLAFAQSFSYKFEFDLGDSENRLADAFFSWNSERWGAVRIGNQKMSQGMSGQASSSSISFMERPLPILAFGLQRRLGVVYQQHSTSWGIKGTVFGPDINKQYGSDGIAARGYYNFTRGDSIVHLAGSVLEHNTRKDRAQLRALPETYGTSTRLVDTGEIVGVSKGITYGLEAAMAAGRYAVRSEFYRATWERKDYTDPSFNGWYIEGSWFITGETQKYRRGQFYRPTVTGKKGGWEVAARYSTVDLNSKGVSGGTENNWSAGINWYSALHWRVMGNVIKVDADGPRGKEDPWIAQMRVQYYF